MGRFVSIFLLVAGVFLASILAGQADAQSNGVIREIVVEGGQRIETDTVRSYLLIREGDAFDPLRVNRSLKSLFATGLFADVSIRRRGETLIVYVTENPVINRIAFEGNDRLKDEELSAEVTLRPRIIYTRSKVQADVKRILTLYRRSGRFAATVEPKVIQLEQNRVNLVFEISEGELTEIRKIRFVGNREFSEGDLLDEIRTRETRWYRLFSSDDRYDPDRLTLDRELLRRFYLNEGYADFRVMSAVAELTPDRSDFFITFTIDEGPRYKFGVVDVDVKLRDLDPEAVKERMEIAQDDWYEVDAIDETVDGISESVGTLGYAFVDVRPRLNRDQENHTIDVTFEVNEGPRVFVERIDIGGNVRTTDEVIRREFRLVEGDAFNAAKLGRSRQRIQNLGFFGKVRVARVPGSAPDKTVIEVEVEEKSTGALTFGAGFSTSQGPLGDITIRERNLLGKGYDAKLSFTLAGTGSELDFSFTDPYFMGREIAAGVDLFLVNQDLQDTQSHDIEEKGFALRASYPLTEDIRQGYRYTFKVSEVTDVDSSASRFIRAAEGEETLSQVGHFITYDTRDNRFSPNEGWYAGFSNDIAGLGGSKAFFRNRLQLAKFFEIEKDWVLQVSGTAGSIVGLGQDVDLSDRFFIGGDTLRGFETAGVGPRDSTTDDALGGELYYTGKVQMRFPLGFPQEIPVNGRVFTDFGGLTELSDTGTEVQDTGSLRAASGVGFTWRSNFGPIGLDLGFPWLKEDFDREETIRVNFGTRF
ncbi:MAG: outer membrane protein assembly factor BamA [Rhodospirillales bacterium]|nr:outer membrane protein assembly factor BamA [Rhodospirillales bacterium]